MTDDELKRLLNITVTTWDTLLAELSEQVAGQIETILKRKLEDSGSAVTEYASPTGRQQIITVKRYPIVSITSIHEDYLREYGSATVVSTSDYFTDPERGLIYRKNRPWYGGSRVVKVIYRGGYTAASGVLQGIPEEWKRAAKMQVAHEWQRRESIGATSQTYAGGGSTSLPETGLLKGVLEILEPWRRRKI